MKLSHIPIRFISIENDGYHLLLKIKINKKFAQVLLDTGASKSVFDRKRIKEFVGKEKIGKHDKLSTGLGTNNMKSHITRISELRIGKLVIRDYPAVLLDLTHINRSYQQMDLRPIDGVIGSDLLYETGAVIDYRKKKLYLQGKKKKK